MDTVPVPESNSNINIINNINNSTVNPNDSNESIIIKETKLIPVEEKQNDAEIIQISSNDNITTNTNTTTMIEDPDVVIEENNKSNPDDKVVKESNEIIATDISTPTDIPTPTVSNNDITNAAAEIFANQNQNKHSEYIATCLSKSSTLKDEGTVLFKNNQYVEAKMKYQEALGFAQTIEQTLNNEEKANIFELCVPCHMNIAVCSMKTKSYSEGIIFAKNVSF